MPATAQSSPSFSFAAAGAMFGPYVVERHLATGGFAHVYLARHSLLDQRVALKVIRDHENAAREQRGARLMCRLDHPGIVKVHFADRVDGHLVIAMDYVDGETLRERLTRAGVLEVADAVRIVAEVCDTLDYLHRFDLDGVSGFAHLDLKPCNIMVDRSDRVKVTDFGLAEVRSVPAIDPLAGSPAYMAPEQFAGDPSPLSDQWAVGVLLRELLTGEPDGIIGHHVPSSVQRVIERCARPVPEERFSSAADIAQALRDALALNRETCSTCGSPLASDAVCAECTSLLSSTTARRSIVPPPAWRSRWHGLVATAALVAVACVAGAASSDGLRSGVIGPTAASARTGAAANAVVDPREEAEARGFAAAQAIDARLDVRISEAMAAWQGFLAGNPSHGRRASARGRLAAWEDSLRNYDGWAELRVISARGFQAWDHGLLANEPQPDPYFMLRVDGQFVYRSLTVPNTAAPVWNESARVYVHPGGALALEVFDRNIFVDRKILSLSLNALPPDGRFERAEGSVIVLLEIRRER